MFGFVSRRERERHERQVEREWFHDLLAQERLASQNQLKLVTETQVAVMAANAAASNVFAEYLKLITGAGAPRVRQMTDEVEAVLEKERKEAWDSARKGPALRDLASTLPNANRVNPMLDPNDFDALKRDLGL